MSTEVNNESHRPPTVMYIVGLGGGGTEATFNIAKVLRDYIRNTGAKIYLGVRIIDTYHDKIEKIRGEDPRGEYIKPEEITYLGRDIFVSQLRRFLETREKAIHYLKENCSWFPVDDKNLWGILEAFVRTTGGVERNRMTSRFLVECVPDIKRSIKGIIENDITSLITKATIEGGHPRQELSLMVWVISTLGGGTGSGTFLTITNYIRETLNKLQIRHMIFPVFYLANAPDESIINMANAYAALKDLVCTIVGYEGSTSLMDVILLSGFAENRAEDTTLGIFESGDEKIADFLLTIHRVPEDPHNRFVPGALAAMLTEGVGILPVGVFDAVKVVIDIDSLVKYMELKSKHDALVDEITPKREINDREIDSFLQKDVENAASDEEIMRILRENVRRTLNYYNTVDGLTYIDKVIEKVIDKIDSLKGDIYNEIDNIVNRTFNTLHDKGLFHEDKDLESKYDTLKTKFDNTFKGKNPADIPTSAYKEILDDINKIIEDLDVAISKKCDAMWRKLLGLSGRCRKGYEKTVNELKKNTKQEIKNKLDKVERLEGFLYGLTGIKRELENRIEDIKKQIREVKSRIAGLVGKLAPGRVREKYSTNTFYVFFSEEGLERLYSEHVKPLAEAGKLDEAIASLKTHGLSFYAEYLKGGRQALEAVIEDMLDELVTNLPVEVDINRIERLRERRILSDNYYLLLDDEDAEMVRSVAGRLGARGNWFREQNTYKLEKLGPRLHMARIIIPLDITMIKDIEILRKAYEGLDERTRFYRHIVPEARDLQLTTNTTSKDVVAACKGPEEKAKEIFERGYDLLGKRPV